MSKIEVQVEPYSKELMDEAQPLLQKHWEEIAFDKDIPLDPDYDHYEMLHKEGCLIIITARFAGALIGYTVFHLATLAHYKTELCAFQDVFFVNQAKRKTMLGAGAALLYKSEEVLKGLGVDSVTHHVKVYQDFGPMLERYGYTFVEKLYQKRL
jgi:hypothetical protein